MFPRHIRTHRGLIRTANILQRCDLWLATGLAAAAILTSSASAAEASVTGLTEPFQHSQISAPVPGIVKSRNFNEGDVVKKGDVILELDHDLEVLEVKRRKLVMYQKWSEFDSTDKLFRTTKGISKEDLEKKEAEYDVTMVEFDMAVEQLQRRLVLAPFSGTIEELSIEVGEAYQPSQTMGRVVDTSRCVFTAYMEPGPAARFKVGQPAKLEVLSGTGPLTVSGKITFTSPVVQSASGLQRIKVEFDNPGGKVVPGVAARIFLD